MLLKKFVTISILSGLFALAQDKPVPPKPAAPKPPAAAVVSSPVDMVIQALKEGTSEALIIRTLDKPMKLSTAEMLKLKKAGASENLIGAMMDPASAKTAPAVPAVAVTAASQPAAAQPPVAIAASDLKGPECPAPAAVAAVAGSEKRRLAVSPFDYSAVQSSVTFWFHNDTNIGQGIRSMLTARMAQSKNIVLLEREKLKTLMNEVDLDGSNRVRPDRKARLGQLTGADAYLLGDIVIFGRDDVSKGKGIGGALPGVFGAAVLVNKEEKAVVAINLRIVDTETGEVLETGEARGESSRKSKDWGALTRGNKGATGIGSDMSSSNFQETIIGEATSDAVNKVIAWLNLKIPAIKAKARTIEGRIANFDGCTLYLSVGGNDSVQVGDHFEIHRIIKEVVDPQTKEVIDQQTEKVGDFIAGTVRDKVTIGQYGGQPLSPGYVNGYAARMVNK